MRKINRTDVGKAMTRYKGSARAVYREIAYPYEFIGDKARVIRKAVRQGKIPKSDFDKWLFNHKSDKEIRELRAYAKLYGIRLPKV